MWFSVVDLFLSCLSSGPISSDTTSLFTQRFKFSFSSLDGAVLIFLKAFSSRSKYINLIIYNHVKNFLAPPKIEPRTSRSEGECSNHYASRPRLRLTVMNQPYFESGEKSRSYVMLF